jgi:hypothetical protein
LRLNPPESAGFPAIAAVHRRFASPRGERRGATYFAGVSTRSASYGPSLPRKRASLYWTRARRSYPLRQA